MSRHADTRSPLRTMTATRSEHISLESDHEVVPSPRPARRAVVLSYVLSSRLRGCQTELAILEDHFLAVRTVRPRGKLSEYEFDLRFANARPTRVRHVSWFWLAVTLLLATLGGATLWSLSSAAGELLPRVLSAALMLLGAGGAAVLFVSRTTEALEFTSAHGGATLVSVTGGIGSARAGKAFFVELIRNINAAKLARPQSRQQLLRDEMREHHRLRELGILTQQQYEASKARILAAH